MHKAISVDEMKKFAHEHYIDIPTKHFFETAASFERRMSPWRQKISDWMELYDRLTEAYEKNKKRLQEFVDLANYVGTSYSEYFPFPEIDFDSWDPASEIELAIQEQEDLDSVTLYNLFLTSGIRERFIYKFINDSITHMPADKSVIVIRSEAQHLENAEAIFPFYTNIAEFDYSLAKLQENPGKYCVTIPYLYDQCIWVAFAPKAFTELELEELCNTVKLGGKLSNAILEYL